MTTLTNFDFIFLINIEIKISGNVLGNK